METLIGLGVVLLVIVIAYLARDKRPPASNTGSNPGGQPPGPEVGVPGPEVGVPGAEDTNQEVK